MTPPNNNHGMSLIVQTVCRGIKAFLLLFGLYVVLYGHLTPGGGFLANFLWPSDGTAAPTFQLFTAGTVPLCNIGIGLKVGASLFLVFGVLAAFRFDRQGRDKREDTSGGPRS